MRERLTFITTGPEQTEAVGRALAGVIRRGEVLALDGPLGAGKTNLVRGLAVGLGHQARAVSSPTFVIVNQYASGGPLAAPLAHVDAYRLRGSDELESVGWDRVMDGHHVVAIEWAARLDDQALGDPDALARLTLTPTDTDVRAITLDAPAAWTARDGWPVLASWAEPASAAVTRCPTCGQPVAPDAPAWPFDQPRCRLADLGRWLTGQYRVSRELQEGDDDPGEVNRETV